MFFEKNIEIYRNIENNILTGFNNVEKNVKGRSTSFLTAIIRD